MIVAGAFAQLRGPLNGVVNGALAAEVGVGIDVPGTDDKIDAVAAITSNRTILRQQIETDINVRAGAVDALNRRIQLLLDEDFNEKQKHYIERSISPYFLYQELDSTDAILFWYFSYDL